jgi:pilus assembly protein TadC
MATLLQLVSSLAAFASMSLFIYWVMTKATALYAEGSERIGSYVVDRDGAEDLGQLPALGSKLGLVFLPVNERLRDSGWLGVSMALERWERLLIRAGLRPVLTAEQFLGACQVSALAGGLLFYLFSFFAFGLGAISAFILGFIPGMVVGFSVPLMMLNNMASNRVAVIEKRLPFAIEFMLLAMEATAALPEAMAVYRDLMHDDPLADEFTLALKDMERGLSQIDALKAMGERIDSDALTAFLLAVNIGLDTGQPIKDVLQTQADATRQRRFQNAEVVAKTAGTKAIFPLFIVVLGVLMLLLGPMAIKVAQEGLF